MWPRRISRPKKYNVYDDDLDFKVGWDASTLHQNPKHKKLSTFTRTVVKIPLEIKRKVLDFLASSSKTYPYEFYFHFRHAYILSRLGETEKSYQVLTESMKNSPGLGKNPNLLYLRANMMSVRWHDSWNRNQNRNGGYMKNNSSQSLREIFDAYSDFLKYAPITHKMIPYAHYEIALVYYYNLEVNRNFYKQFEEQFQHNKNNSDNNSDQDKWRRLRILGESQIFWRVWFQIKKSYGIGNRHAYYFLLDDSYPPNSTTIDFLREVLFRAVFELGDSVEESKRKMVNQFRFPVPNGYHGNNNYNYNYNYNDNDSECINPQSENGDCDEICEQYVASQYFEDPSITLARFLKERSTLGGYSRAEIKAKLNPNNEQMRRISKLMQAWSNLQFTS